MSEDQGGNDEDNSQVTRVCELRSDGSIERGVFIDINTPRDAKDYKSIHV